MKPFNEVTTERIMHSVAEFKGTSFLLIFDMQWGSRSKQWISCGSGIFGSFIIDIDVPTRNLSEQVGIE